MGSCFKPCINSINIIKKKEILRLFSAYMLGGGLRFKRGMFMEESIRKHNVKVLVHFTKCDNLESIYRYGLFTRKYIIDNDIYSVFSDSNRFDGYEDAICTSISFPNYKMFYKLRNRYKNVRWAIIIIDKKVLVDKECAFCIDNAASNSEISMPIQRKKGKEAFNRLFDEYPNQVSREILGINRNMTTNPQSEVLVFGNIGLNYIIGVVFENEDDEKQYGKNIPKSMRSIVYEDFYKWRMDYEYWR